MPKTAREVNHDYSLPKLLVFDRVHPDASGKTDAVSPSSPVSSPAFASQGFCASASWSGH
jgi:hypothetical protein